MLALAGGPLRKDRCARLTCMDTDHWQDVSPRYLEPVRENTLKPLLFISITATPGTFTSRNEVRSREAKVAF